MIMRRLGVVLFMVFVALGCARPGEQGDLSGAEAVTPSLTPDTSLRGDITFAGSTTVQPLARELKAVFNALYPNVTLDIAAGGSTVGINAIHAGTVDIGMASRNLKPEEKEGIEQHQIAVDVIAVVVHQDNAVENLTLEQLRDIYLGKITNWQDVGGPDSEITVIIREKNSGTRGAFDKIVLDGQEPIAPHLEKAITAGDMAVMVAENSNAVGYVGFGNLEPEIKLVAIDGVIPSDDTARDGSYRLVRPLLLLTGPLTQPVAHQFVEFAVGERGQQVVVDNGWVPVK